MTSEATTVAAIPMHFIGPVKIIGTELNDEIHVPLATFETPLWPSTNRGARATHAAGGIQASILFDHMTRSVVLEAPSGLEAIQVAHTLEEQQATLAALVRTTSRFARLKDWHVQVVGKLLYLRFALTTGDASGHNMVTKAADSLLHWILKNYPRLSYVSVSGNLCCDKKASAVNGLLGRGKYVVAEVVISAAICQKMLRTTPQKIVDLNVKKNLLGSIAAGSIRSANAHFANMLLGLYLATGQDAANIVEGSQGMVHCELQNNDLYFSVTLPNIIVGTVGNGKDLPFVKQNLTAMGCLNEREPGQNSRRLALITGAVVLCGELSLLAAQTNRGELVHSHMVLERQHNAVVHSSLVFEGT